MLLILILTKDRNIDSECEVITSNHTNKFNFCVTREPLSLPQRQNIDETATSIYMSSYWSNI